MHTGNYAIKRSENQISLCMEYYWKKLMKKFGVKSDEIENAPINENQKIRMPRRAQRTTKNELSTDNWIYHLRIHPLQIGLSFPGKYAHKNYALTG